MPNYTELSEANGWIPEPASSDVLTRVSKTSAVEAAARREPMSSRTVSVPRFKAQGVDIVAEHGTIPFINGTPDEVVLNAVKFANRFAISIEDSRDAQVDALQQFKLEWASNFAVKLDNACLGTTVVGNGTTVPFTSVYAAAVANSATNRIATASGVNITYDNLVKVFGDLQSGDYGDDLVAIAHPAFAMQLRNLKDAGGLRVTTDPLGGEVPSVFGYDLYFSRGARTSATATDTPAGNPLLIVGSKRNLILGVRDGVESAVSDQPSWATDELEVKMRARRGFAVADGSAFRVIELTA